jgi:hypothetical protein
MDPKARLAGLAVIGLIVFLAGYLLANNIWQAKWDRAEKQAAQNQLTAVNKAVEEYNTVLAKQRSENSATEAKLAIAATAGLNADIANDSLQQQLSTYLRRGSKCPASTASTEERAAVATEQLVLAELFRRANTRAGELAKIADDARIRGLACEVSYNLVLQ